MKSRERKSRRKVKKATERAVNLERETAQRRIEKLNQSQKEITVVSQSLGSEMTDSSIKKIINS